MINYFKNHYKVKNALAVFVSISLFAILYHLLIIFKIVPYEYAWGGRLKSVQQMYVFEIFSLLMQLLFIVVSIFKYHNPLNKYATITLYIIFGLLLLNTIGNIFALSLFEALIFTPLTFVGSISALRLAMHQPSID